MISVLANRTYRHLFVAQVIALIETGLVGKFLCDYENLSARLNAPST